MKTLLCSLAWILGSVPATCQTRPIIVPFPCPAPAGQVQIVAYAIVAPSTQVAPVCLTLGPGFSVDMNTKTINVASNGVTTPPPLIESFALDPATPVTTTTALFTLSKTPQPGTPMFAIFVSSQATGSITTATPAGNNNQVAVNIPAYRPFTATDRIAIVYWAQ